MELTENERIKQDGSNGSVTLEVIDNIAVIHFKRGENRVNWAWIQAVDDILDQVESNPDIRALITTGEGKFYCNGLDRQWLAYLSKSTPPKIREFINIRMSALMCRFLTFPVPTIAAINGHCYAAGVLIALCHDYSIMNTDKGWFCLNEVHIKLTFSEMSTVILRSKLPAGAAFHNAAVLGKQYTAEEAHKEGIISQVCSRKELLPVSITLANKLTQRRVYDRSTLQDMKRVMYSDVIQKRNVLAASSKVSIASRL